MNKDFTRHMTHEALIILGVLAFFTFMFRLWPLLVLVIFCIIGGAIRLLFLKAKGETVKQTENKTDEPKRAPTEKDVRDLAFSVILTRISDLVSSEFPEAKWVWEKPNARKLIESGEDAFILLSGAGGYRRAKVKIQNLQVTGLDYVTVTFPEKPKDETDTDAEEDLSKPIPVNYGLIAFEWVEAHVMDLNDHINDAIAQGLSEYLITEEELPVRESWAAIIEELGRQDIENATEDPHGIKINIKQ